MTHATRVVFIAMMLAGGIVADARADSGAGSSPDVGLLYGPAQGQTTTQYDVAQSGGTLHGRVLFNETGQDANDLHVNLNTSLPVPQAASFPFPNATPVTGNDQFKTRIDFEGATVRNGQITFIAWESPVFGDGITSANWTSNGNDIGPATLATGLRLVITDAGNGKVRLTMENTGANGVEYGIDVRSGADMAFYDPLSFPDGLITTGAQVLSDFSILQPGGDRLIGEFTPSLAPNGFVGGGLQVGSNQYFLGVALDPVPEPLSGAALTIGGGVLLLTRRPGRRTSSWSSSC